MQWDVFVADRRAGGAVNHWGVIAAETESDARDEAECRWGADLRDTEMMYVRPAPPEDEDQD